jgi:hypothetical protein
MHQFFDLHLKLFLDVKKCIENPAHSFFYKKLLIWPTTIKYEFEFLCEKTFWL